VTGDPGAPCSATLAATFVRTPISVAPSELMSSMYASVDCAARAGRTHGSVTTNTAWACALTSVSATAAGRRHR